MCTQNLFGNLVLVFLIYFFVPSVRQPTPPSSKARMTSAFCCLFWKCMLLAVHSQQYTFFFVSFLQGKLLRFHMICQKHCFHIHGVAAAAAATNHPSKQYKLLSGWSNLLKHEDHHVTVVVVSTLASYKRFCNGTQQQQQQHKYNKRNIVVHCEQTDKCYGFWKAMHFFVVPRQLWKGKLSHAEKYERLLEIAFAKIGFTEQLEAWKR